MLVNVTGGNDMSLHQVSAATSVVYDAAGSDANVAVRSSPELVSHETAMHISTPLRPMLQYLSILALVFETAIAAGSSSVVEKSSCSISSFVSRPDHDDGLSQWSIAPLTDSADRSPSDKVSRSML